MTLFVCDGEYVLMDKITKETLEYNHLHLENRYRHYNKRVSYHERISKLNGINKPVTIKAWGKEILTWTTIGRQRSELSDLFNLKTLGDLETVLEIFTLYTDKKLLGTETTLLFVTPDSYVEIDWSHESQSYTCYETSLEAIKDHRHNAYYGYAADNLRLMDNDLLGSKLTALEAMVFSQAMDPELGDTFDSYHIPTRKATYNISLSDRQRKMITDKIYARIQQKHSATPWYQIR